MLINHVTHLVEYFGDRCYAWDVVNEALSDSGTGNLADNSTWRSDIWYNTIGPNYVAVAFKAAEAAVKANKLKVKLYYNDYNIESAGNKATAAQALVKSLKDAGIQIDGAGLQSHFIVGSTPSRAAQTANMNAFAALGVDVAITELDIRTTVPATAAAQQQQVVDYASSVGACADVDACVGVTAWDFDDAYSWIPSTFPGQGYGDLFFQPGGYGTPLVRKAAYDGCIQVSRLCSRLSRCNADMCIIGSHQLDVFVGDMTSCQKPSKVKSMVRIDFWKNRKNRWICTRVVYQFRSNFLHIHQLLLPQCVFFPHF